MCGVKKKKIFKNRKKRWQSSENYLGLSVAIQQQEQRRKYRFLKMQGSICQNGREKPTEVKTASVGNGLSTVMERGEMLLAMCNRSLQWENPQ